MILSFSEKTFLWAPTKFNSVQSHITPATEKPGADCKTAQLFKLILPI